MTFYKSFCQFFFPTKKISCRLAKANFNKSPKQLQLSHLLIAFNPISRKFSVR